MNPNSMDESFDDYYSIKRDPFGKVIESVHYANPLPVGQVAKPAPTPDDIWSFYGYSTKFPSFFSQTPGQKDGNLKNPSFSPACGKKQTED